MINWRLNKKKVRTIRRKGLNKFEGQSTGTQGWFELDIKFFLTYSKSHSEFYKDLFKNSIEDQYTEVYALTKGVDKGNDSLAFK